jgi:DNA polymerase III epsilon subunit family exonuclease
MEAQLTFDAADRLVDLVEERRAPVAAEEAARALFALAFAPAGLAHSLLDDVVSGDARLAWRGSTVTLANDPTERLPLEAARYVVVDLETTGLRPGRAAICEIGAVRLEGLTHTGTFQTLVDPGVPIPPVVTSLTGIEDRDLAGAPSPVLAVQRFLDFASGAVLVAHNARFDIGFLDREVELVEGRRLAAPIIDTVGLARRLLAGRVARASLSSLSHFFGTSTQPCHRALPDAEATAEILLRLIGIAQERGARTVADLGRLAAPRTRRVYDKRALAFGAPSSPGVYLFVGKGEQILYVGRARNLRERLRSYFRSDRQRPAVEAALAAVERIEWRVLGSELEAALEELRLIREERPPANARSSRPDRYLYFGRRADRIVVSSTPARARASSPRSPPEGRCPGFARSSATSLSPCATRTLRASATASPRSSRSSRISPNSNGCGPHGFAFLRLPSSRGFGARSLSPAVGWRRCARCRGGRPLASSWRQGWRRHAPVRSRSHPRTPTSSSWSGRFCAALRPSWRLYAWPTSNAGTFPAMSEQRPVPETPDEDVPQDPGIPGEPAAPDEDDDSLERPSSPDDPRGIDAPGSPHEPPPQH